MLLKAMEGEGYSPTFTCILTYISQISFFEWDVMNHHKQTFTVSQGWPNKMKKWKNSQITNQSLCKQQNRFHFLHNIFHDLFPHIKHKLQHIPSIFNHKVKMKCEKKITFSSQFQFFKHTPNKHIPYPPTNNLQPFPHTPYLYRNKTLTKLNLRTNCPVFNNPQINQHIFKSNFSSIFSSKQGKMIK